MILSDVIGDPIDLIASGATVPPMSQSKSDLLQVLTKYKSVIEEQKFPNSVRKHLYHSNITFPDHDHRISSYVIGNNMVALNAAADIVKQHGYLPIILSNTVEGDVVDLGNCFSKLALFTCHVLNGKHSLPYPRDFLDSISSILPSTQSFISQITNSSKVCLLTSGEPTVHVEGDGIGGRNQELCVHFAKYFHLHSTSVHFNDGNVTFMSVGTDGQDGPTDAAGAIVDGNSWMEFSGSLLNPEDALQQNDSYTLMKQLNHGANLIQTGLTGTNVMDIHVLLIDN